MCSSFVLKTAPFCKLSADLGSTNKSSISLPFSSSQSLALFLLHFPLLRLSFYQTLSGLPGRHYPPSSSFFLSGYNEFSVTYFFGVMMPSMSSSDQVRCSSNLPSHVVYHLSYPFFRGSNLSHLKSFTRRSSE